MSVGNYLKYALLVIIFFLHQILSDTNRSFPADFLFGAATSAYQIEGGWNVEGITNICSQKLTEVMDIVANIAICLATYLVVNYSLNFIGYKAISRVFQKHWEEQFLREHRYFILDHPDNSSNDYIELTIKNRKVENLSSLCGQYYSEYTANRYVNKLIERFDPSIETNYVGFRRVNDPSRPEPVRAEIIRCNKTYALIASEEEDNPFRNTAYSLTKAKHNDGVNGELFFINGKFRIKERIPHSEADQTDFENEFLTRNHDYLEQNRGNLQNVTMPSNFDEEETTRFKLLCKKFGSMWPPFVKKPEPSVEPIYLDFRRVDSNPGPVRIEMIKCANKHAIMLAEKNVAIYILTEGKYVESLRTNVFNIFLKFPYKNENQILLTHMVIDDMSNSNSSEKSYSEEPTTSQQSSLAT